MLLQFRSNVFVSILATLKFVSRNLSQMKNSLLIKFSIETNSELTLPPYQQKI
jgi:hypothetical protein